MYEYWKCLMKISNLKLNLICNINTILYKFEQTVEKEKMEGSDFEYD